MDIREYKGAYFTPKIWVELSQKYLADVLGENWQDEYYVWDCAAGTGNLLAGLTNKSNIWASTLDKADVDVMKDRIKNGANLLAGHVFQFDFLNDGFSKLPKGLREIIEDEEKRKKLVIYINPPYAEADSRKGEGRLKVAISTIHEKYSEKMGYSKRELSVHFLTRIYCEIPDCILANFSKLKNLQTPRFSDFRKFFQPKLERVFLVPADTFDNVKGSFPIGFHIWDTKILKAFKQVRASVYDENGNYAGKKKIVSYDNVKFINDWVKTFRKIQSDSIATIIGVGSDFQNQRLVRFGEPYMEVPADNHHWQISKDNLIESCIYYTVRKILPVTWLNDRDQFLWPNNGWETDKEFQNDCFAYTLFSNNMQSENVINHWIPFTEKEVNAKEKFASNFMTNYMAGKIKVENMSLFDGQAGNKKLVFSEEAQTVFNAGRKLWKFYHEQPYINVNASLYDIREHFQGRNDKGRMNAKSSDIRYSQLLFDLRTSLSELAKKIQPKIYDYGFLIG